MVKELYMFLTFKLRSKNDLAVPHCLFKVFHLQLGWGTLDYPWYNNFCRTYQELGQGNFCTFDQKKVPFLQSYLLPTVKNLTTGKIMRTQLIHNITNGY